MPSPSVVVPGGRGPVPPTVPGYLPPPAPTRPALTEREMGRMRFRIDLFQSRGFPQQHAERWADVLQHRDWTRDDRRMCTECCHLKADWSCRENGVVAVDRLQRCELFGWEMPR